MRLRILILAGGWSREREVSIKSGQGVYEGLPKDRFQVEILDPKEDMAGFLQRLGQVDLVINMLHGFKGEDGAIQGLLEVMGVRYLGSGVLGSALAMDKFMSKIIYRHYGLKVPEAALLEDERDFEKIEAIHLPLVAKPVNEGSSFGVKLCKTSKEAFWAAKEGLQQGYRMLLEEYIEGVELTCCVIGNKTLEALPIVEIRPVGAEFFDFVSKYEKGKAIEICPAEIEPRMALKAQEAGIIAHKALNLRNFSRTDMILKGDEIYVLETNTLPGMTQTSLFPLAAKARGWTMADLLTRLVELAMENT